LLSLAIGRNGQNVRLASQLIGWQIDLYGSREWLERGADLSLFSSSQEEQYETADFPLAELDLTAGTLAALSAAGYDTFLQIIDLERRDFLGIAGLGEEDADRLLQLIDELTVVEGEQGSGDAGGDDDGEEPRSEGAVEEPVEEATAVAVESDEDGEPEE
jgi:N utilization substance protein A